MGNLVGKILRNVATRIMFIIYVTIILLTSFFIIFGYYTQLNLQEERQYDRLTAIVSSLVIAIDGDDHQLMMQDFRNKDDIKSNEENLTYKTIHKTLSAAAKSNDLQSAIYILVRKGDGFQFSVTSDEQPYFRHEYSNYPQILIDSFDVGGIIPSYKSENGVWLSAFYPIKNKANETVALLEADIEFSSFIADVRKQYLSQALIALGFIVLIALVLIPYSRKILKQEEVRQKEIEQQSAIIEEKNRDITDSINYALKIQSTILPPLGAFDEFFEDNFVFFKPKDIVAGDFYFLQEFEGVYYVAVADCTGHGVPGAMVSVICSYALSYVVLDSKITSPGEILDAVTDIVVEKFKSSPDGIKDGMDICLCKIDTKNRTVEYSGANNPLYVITDGGLQTYKPNKQPIGQFEYRVPFDTLKLQLKKDDCVYLFTDGFADQFGGDKGKKLKYKTFQSELIRIHTQPMKNQVAVLDAFFEEWKADYEQVDDVCVIGIRF